MTQSTENNCDIQLPGYVLERKIGSGGYGEVWLAHAPGGLTKAVKFIFGYHNEKRAASELHSLEKIKAVRHPFLLSLERIEVIEGRLVIVTELADGSLKDRFDQSVESGLSGIERQELLGYLRDSADALDYLRTQHSLQHLDVKPENLLLLAGHVKVADFGLVKEIQETQASLVGGLTPLYSAPEVFQGRPTCYSDQYSLAVLYQEMLTGRLPFDGLSSAELTLQHMHDEPNLLSLPLAERYIVARALSKNPEQRYNSCSEFVQALLDVERAEESRKENWSARPASASFKESNESVTTAKKSRPGTVTQVFEDDLVEDAADLSRSMMIDLPAEIPEETVELPAFDLQAEGFSPTPTLVIGIGGTAGHVLSQLRKRISNRFGADDAVPALQLLLLDTDKNSLLAAIGNGREAGLTSEETMTLQLRRPQEYRDNAKGLLGWLSRRWLYNIPKSLRTEGLRPLGRLAFADHARRTIQRIRLSLSQAMDQQAIDISGKQTGQSFQNEAVRVYVVASISGGTGSGMSIDLGYALKGLLEKLGIQKASTTGVFLHSTGRESRTSDLAKVNAFSWLKEYNHFSRPEGFYPGDDASGLPAMPTGTLAFDNTYFLQLGNGISPEQLKQNTDVVAQYLFLDSLTSAQTFFEASREAQPTTVAGNPALRTFGLHEESAASEQSLQALSQQLCQRVVLGWSGDKSHLAMSETLPSAANQRDHETASMSDTNQIVSGAPRAVAHLHLNLEGISANARTILEGQFGADVEGLLAKLLAEAQSDTSKADARQVMKLVDTLFTSAPGAEDSSGEFVFGRRIDAIVSPLGMKLSTDLQRWLLHRLDENQERLSGTRQAAEWFAEHFQRVEADCQRIAHGLSRQLVEMVNSTTDSDGRPAAAMQLRSEEAALELAIKYFRLRLDRSALQATHHLVRILQTELKMVREAIVEFGRHLRHLADTLAPDTDSEGNELNLITQDPISQALFTKLGDLATKVDQQLQEQFINEQGGLFQTVMGNRKVIDDLQMTLQTIAQQRVNLAAREICTSEIQVLDSASLADYAAQASPKLLELGGIASQLVVSPQTEGCKALSNQVRDALGEKASVLTGTEGNLTVCSEVGQLPLMNVAINLIECRRDFAEFADRVHTRNDISWTPLIEAKQSASSIAVSQCMTQVL